jgi:hypothetical protein
MFCSSVDFLTASLAWVSLLRPLWGLIAELRAIAQAVWFHGGAGSRMAGGSSLAGRAGLGSRRRSGVHMTLNFDRRARASFDFEVKKILQDQPELWVRLEW